MKNRICLFAAALFCFATAVPAQDYVEGEVLVRFKGGSQQSLRVGAEVNGCTVCRNFSSLSQNSSEALVHLRDLNRSTKQLIELFEGDPSVEWVEPNFLRYTTRSALSNDPNLGLQWGLNNTGQNILGVAGISDSDTDWAESRLLSSDTLPEVMVGIIDTGSDLNHADLIDSVFINPGEIPGNGIDDDNNGYIDDIHGYDFSGDFGAPPDPDPADIDDHGTHVSGIAAAISDNGLGVAGISRAMILPLKASPDFNTSGFFLTTAAIIAAMEYAVDMKQRGFNIVAINGSYGSSSFSASEEIAMQALASEGIVFVAAAGNDNANNDQVSSYPANYSTSNVISVAATTNRDQRASFSNFGATSVDIGAPGDDIYATVRAAYPSAVATTGSSYLSNSMTYSGLTESITRPYYDCGLGGPNDFPAQVEGNIALIERGTFFFSEKVQNAMNAGAVAAIVYDNTTSPDVFGGTLQYLNDWIPAITINRASGLDLLASAGQNITVSVTMTDSTAYGYISGTSMAAPMVTGAIAVLAQHFPEDTMSERIQRLYDAADPIPALNGLVATGARLNVGTALDVDNDNVPDWFEEQIFAATGANVISATSDSDGDGTLDIWEFRAGTDPADPSDSFQVSGITGEGGATLELVFPSAEGRTYTIFSTPSLDQDFTILQSGIVGTPPENTALVPADGETGFYQVDLDWPE